MSRLVTFGCSFTYGYGLPDCWDAKNCVPTSNPSQFAWPSLLAQTLNRECVNLSESGSGNFQIMLSIFDTTFQPDDLVITAFSYFERYHQYKIITYDGQGQFIKHNTLEHKQLTIEELGQKNYKEKNYWDNWLTIQHVELFLKNKKLQNFSYLGVPIGSQHPVPTKLVTLDNFLPELFLTVDDKALDNAHPGVESNKIQAQNILNAIDKLGNSAIAR